MSARKADHSRHLRWPLQPLLDRAKLTAHCLGHRDGFSTDAVRDARDNGLSDLLADRWATKLGLHPTQVWASWDLAGLTASDDLFVNGSATSGPGWRQAWEWHEARTRALHVAPVATEAPETTREAA